ncbi:MAG: GNAT family N-acetyltransferase [Neisseriaceae bacterium]|nr:MAG: GNAT family N-acetyltransferase [Neisseriaceae bacterium]
MDIKIREANIEELSKIYQLQQICFQSQAKLYNNCGILPPLTETLEYLKQIQKIVKFLIVEKGEEIIGSVRYVTKGNHCHILRLMVKPEFQGQGIATKLLLYVEEQVPNNVYNVFTGYDNECNLNLYHKVGYENKWLENFGSSFSFVHLQKKVD